MLAIYMFSSFTQDERMAGNFREKSRAVDVAQSALDAAANTIKQENSTSGSWVTGLNCTTISGTPSICSNTLANPKTLPWSASTTYTPSGMSVANSGQNNYSSNPNYYIEYLGPTSSAQPTALYRVTATASGGSSTAVTVIQAVYQVQASSVDLGGN